MAFNKITYYSVKFEHEENSEFEKFILKHQSLTHIKNEYNDLLSLIKRLGEREGAKPRYFSRNEKKADALPPNWNELLPYERKLHVKYQHNLRLYCLRMSDQIVFLFNGGIKTPGKITAQQCKEVKEYFYWANKFSAAIEEACYLGDVELNGMKLVFNEDFELKV